MEEVKKQAELDASPGGYSPGFRWRRLYRQGLSSRVILCCLLWRNRPPLNGLRNIPQKPNTRAWVPLLPCEKTIAGGKWVQQWGMPNWGFNGALCSAHSSQHRVQIMKIATFLLFLVPSPDISVSGLAGMYTAPGLDAGAGRSPPGLNSSRRRVHPPP